MIDNFFEVISVSITFLAFLFGAIRLLGKDRPSYFKFYVCAVGCYAIEEVWVLVNTFFGQNENMISIRLVALFGCLCFFLTASAKYLDGMVDSGQKENRTARIVALVMPAILLSLYAYFAVVSKSAWLVKIMVFIVMLPGVISSYYNLKHLLMKAESSKYIPCTRPVNAAALLFFLAIFSYLIPQVSQAGRMTLEILDACAAGIFALIILLSERGARKWKTT